jgi:glycosyltransferase involved in cell wall biosynthesis
VSRALKDSLIALDVPADKIQVLRNGVDLEFFKPVERERVRQRLDMRRRTLLSVGNLLAFKGHGVVIQALALLQDCDLVIIGDGPDRIAFQALARECGVGERVRFAGPITQDELREYYGAADALVLASSREGWPNVLLEALACGTPVVATSVGGMPEIVASTEAGLVVSERTAEALAGGLRQLFSSIPDRAATRRYAEQFSWAATTKGQLDLFRQILRVSGGVTEMRAAGAG